MSSSLCCPAPPPCRAICHQCHASVPTPSSLFSDLRTKKSGTRPALVFHHIVLLLVCFVSHGFTSVSHPKFLFCFEVKPAKLGGQFSYFASKSFASFRFSFEAKFGDTQVLDAVITSRMFYGPFDARFKNRGQIKWWWNRNLIFMRPILPQRRILCHVWLRKLTEIKYFLSTIWIEHNFLFTPKKCKFLL